MFWRAKWQALFALHAFNTTPKMVTADLDGLTYFHTEGKKKPDTQPWTDFQEWRASQTMVILYYRHKSTQEIFIRQNFATQDDWHVFLSLVRWSIPHGYSSIIHKA